MFFLPFGSTRLLIFVVEVMIKMKKAKKVKGKKIPDTFGSFGVFVYFCSNIINQNVEEYEINRKKRK